jgi:hypothetical protein
LAAPAGSGRLLVESSTDGSWRVLTHPAQLNALKAALDPRGLRESGLYSALARLEADIRAAMPGQPLALPAETGGARRCTAAVALGGRRCRGCRVGTAAGVAASAAV